MRGAGCPQHGLSGWQQLVVPGEHRPMWEGEQRGAVPSDAVGAGCGCPPRHGQLQDFSSCRPVPAGEIKPSRTQEPCRGAAAADIGTLCVCGVSAGASTLSLQHAIYLPSSLAVPRSYLRILILICFRIRYILALQHCAAMTTGLHFCCLHTLVFLVLGLFPSSYSLALKT